LATLSAVLIAQPQRCMYMHTTDFFPIVPSSTKVENTV